MDLCTIRKLNWLCLWVMVTNCVLQIKERLLGFAPVGYFLQEKKNSSRYSHSEKIKLIITLSFLYILISMGIASTLFLTKDGKRDVFCNTVLLNTKYHRCCESVSSGKFSESAPSGQVTAQLAFQERTHKKVTVNHGTVL